MTKPSIGLLGANGAGKTTIADYLVAEHGYRKLSFAEPLRELARLNKGWYMDELALGYDKAKELEPGFRQYLIDLGEGIRKYDPVFFVKALAQQITDMDPDRPWVIDDVRKQQEVNFLHDMGFRFIHVRRGTRDGSLGYDMLDSGLTLPTSALELINYEGLQSATQVRMNTLLRHASWALGTPKEGSLAAAPDPKEVKADGSTPVHEQLSPKEGGGGSAGGDGESEDAPHWCARCEREWERGVELRTPTNRAARARWYADEGRRHRDEGSELRATPEVRDGEGDTVGGNTSGTSRVVINPSHWPSDVRPPGK